jgi:sulfofructosephosphate aldolase
MPPPGDPLARLRRPSGAFAMLALDQRESLRTMLHGARGSEGDDAEVGAFKVAAAEALTPEASAVLLDLETGLTPVQAADAIAPGCALILAADALTQERGGPVMDTAVDEAVFEDPRAADADAFKLLVMWHPDRGAHERAAVVRRFLERCRERGRPGLVEGVVRRPADAGGDWDHVAAVLACAEELGALGPDIYKAEVPTLGAASDEAIARAAGRLTGVLDCPWVVLSNGTPRERFDDAAVAACRGGASGFLAGRALWSGFLDLADPSRALEEQGRPRLRALAARVDDVVGTARGGRRVTFIHTVGTLEPVFQGLAAELLPGTTIEHVVDEGLLAEAIAAGHVPDETSARLERHVGEALAAGSRLVVVTCSSMGPAVDAIVERTGWPVIRVDAAMVDRALDLGRRIGVLATLRTTLEPTAALVRDRAAARGATDVTVTSRLAEGAFGALKAGDPARHDALVRAAFRDLIGRVEVIVLAQASMARVAEQLGDEAAGTPILASPRLGVERAAALVRG